MTTKAQVLTILMLGATVAVASAQTVQPTLGAPITPPPPLSSTEQTIKDIKNPFSWMTWGADLRVRNEYFNDLLTLNPNANLHQQDYFRFRGRVFTTITPVDDVSANVRLTAEPREWMLPAGYTSFRGKEGMAWYYGIFDSMNVQWRNVASLPLTITAGRQDIFLGDGYLVCDGTPLDGSWTTFLDSARLTYVLKEQHTTVDVIGIIQNASNNAWIPVINTTGAGNLTEQDEKGAILQVANTSIKEANLTGYFIYKGDSKVAPNGDNANLYTFGGRVSGLVQEHWKYSVEGAYQCGDKQDGTINNSLLAPSAQTTGFRTMNAFAGNTKLSYLFNDAYNNQLSLSYEFISGDNPNTKNDEMFDVLWGRWPRWGEIGLYMYANETRIGQEGNLHRFGPTWSVSPTKQMTFSASYYALFSEQQVATRGNTTVFTENGNFRGHFAQAVLKYTFSKHVNGHLWGELFFPGDYYAYTTVIPFLRAEVTFSL